MYVRNAIQGPAGDTRPARETQRTRVPRFSPVRPAGTPVFLPTLIALFLLLQVVLMTWLFRLPAARVQEPEAAESAPADRPE